MAVHTIPSFFVEAEYLQSKLAQLKTLPNPPNISSITALKQVMADAGFTPFSHFQRFNLVELTSPNNLFDANYYLAAKAKQLNDTNVVKPGTGGLWTAADVQLALNAAKFTSVFEHFQKHGVDENINASAAFDTSSYFDSKLADFRKTSPDATLAQLTKAFKDAGLDPITHFIRHGVTEKIAVTPVSAAELVAGASTQTGQTFPLTTGVDNFPGTSGNDTFIAVQNGATEAVQTFSTGDIINGGNGIDTLSLTITDATTGPLVTTVSVENFEIQTTVAETVNALNFSSPALITNNQSTVTLTVSNVNALATVAVKGGATVAAETAVQFIASLLTGASDTVKLSFNGSTDTGAVRADNNTGGGGVETFAISSTGTNKVAALTVGTDTKAVTFAGSGALTVTATIANATSLDASASTGKITVASAVADVVIKGGSAADSVTLGHASGVDALSDKVSVTLGEGDDTLTLTLIDALNEIKDGAKLDGGAGTDTLVLDDALAAAFNGQTLANNSKKGITGFEKLTVATATTAADIIAVDKIGIGNSINHVTFAAAATATTTVTGVTTGGTVELRAAANGLAVTVAGAGEAGANNDTFAIKLNGTHAGADIDYGVISIANVETINIESTSAKTTALVADDTNQIDLTLANIKVLNVSGNVKADLDGAALTASSLETINASGNTGGLTITVAGATQGVTITGTSKADIIIGGSGNDNITAGAGNDVITGGAGNDIINISGGGSNTLTFAATAADNGKDTITGFNVGTVASGGDILEVSAILGAHAITGTVTNLTGAQAIANDNIFIVNFAAAISSKDFGEADFAELFGAGKVFSTTNGANSDEAVIVVQGTDVTQIYYFDSGADTTIIAAEVTMVGVLNGITNANTFNAANFA